MLYHGRPLQRSKLISSLQGEERLFNSGVHHRDGRPGKLNGGQISQGWDVKLLKHCMTTTHCDKPSDLSATQVQSFSFEGRFIVLIRSVPLNGRRSAVAI